MAVCPFLPWVRQLVGRPLPLPVPEDRAVPVLLGTAVLSNMTCLICVYSSNEYADMSLPKPDALYPPCGISLMIGMWSLTQTQPALISRVARFAR